MWKSADNIGTDEVCYVDELPERDIGPNTSEDVLLQELKQMSNEYSRMNFDVEVSRMRKLEDIYRLTDNAAVGQVLDNVFDYKEQIKDRKRRLENMFKPQDKQQRIQKKKNGPLAIADGSGLDILESDFNNIGPRMKSMEKRILEAKRALQAKGIDPEMQRALKDYYEVFKQSLGSIEDIGSTCSNNQLKTNSIQKAIAGEIEANIVPSGIGDAEVAKGSKELKILNDYKLFDLNPIPFTPELHCDIDEINEPNMSYNDVLEYLDVKNDLLEIPLSKFLDNSKQSKAAKSIMKKIEEKEGRDRKKSSKKLKKSISFRCEP